MAQRWIAFAVGMSLLWTLMVVVVFEHRTRSSLMDDIEHLKTEIATLKATQAPAKQVAAPELHLRHEARATGIEHDDHHPMKNARRLGGFLKSATVAANAKGVACLEVSGGTAVGLDLSSASCANSLPCPHCFIATSLSADIDLKIVDCQAALIKSGLAMNAASATHVLELVFINMDATNTLTLKGCVDGTCSSPASTYALGPGESVVGYCYTGGSSAVNWPTGISHCPKGCDAAAPNDRTGTAFTNGLVTSSKVSNINDIGTNAPTSGKTIATADWDYLAEIVCTSSAGSAAHGDYTLAAATQTNDICQGPLSEGTPNTCTSLVAGVHSGTISITASANDVSNICTSTR